MKKFTLIEVLVVVAIFAILANLIMAPILRQKRIKKIEEMRDFISLVKEEKVANRFADHCREIYRLSRSGKISHAEFMNEIRLIESQLEKAVKKEAFEEQAATPRKSSPINTSGPPQRPKRSKPQWR